MRFYSGKPVQPSVSLPSASPTLAPNHSPATRTAWRWLFAGILMALVVTASGRSEIAGPPGIPGMDKIAHLSVFGLLATLIVRSPGTTRRWPLFAVLLVSFFGMSDEWHQSFTPGREVEFADWVADTFGAALAVSLYTFWPFYRRLLETPLRLPRRARPSPALAAKPVSASSSSAA